MQRKSNADAGTGLLDLAAMLAVACTAVPFAVMPLRSFPRAPIPLLMLAAFGLFALGWGLQALVCRLLRHNRAEEGGGYEKSQKYYRFGLTLPVWGAAVLIFFLLPSAVDRLLYHIAATGTAYLYDAMSVFPFTVGLAAAVLIILGSAVRLYPYTRVLSLRACMTYLALFLVGFALGGGGISAFCLFLFALCAAFLLNRIALDRDRRTLSLPAVSRDTRTGGLQAVLRLILAFTACSAVLVIIVGGGMMVGRMLLFLLLRNAFSGEGDASANYETSDEVIGSLERFLVRAEESPFLNYLLMILFFIGIILLILWFALCHNAAIMRLLRRLWDRITAFIDWLFSASSRLYYRTSESTDEVSYRDVRKKLTPPAHTAITQAELERLSWRALRNRLNACPDDAARLALAYPILAEVLRAQPHFPLLRADTPRRIEEKVRARGRHEELREITPVYELISYADRAPDPARLHRALTLTCRILQEYLA